MNAEATVTATTAIDSRRKKTLLALALMLVVVANLFVMVTVFVLKLFDVEDLMVA